LPKIVIQTPAQIDCKSDNVKIDASAGSNGSQYTYNWTTTNGSIVSGETTNILTVNDQGDYVFHILNTLNGCKNDTTIKIIKDLSKPTVTINPPAELNCTTPTVTIDATSSSNGANFTFEWKTSDGSFLSGTNSYSPLVNNSGTYWLVIKNSSNNCSDSANVVVKQSVDLPKALIIKPSLLGCNKTTMILDGSLSSTGAIFTYSWFTSNGNFAGPTNTLTPSIDKGGDYTLVMTNTASNCKDTATVNVVEDKVKPKILLPPPNLLTCKNPTITLDASASDNGINFAPSWYSNNNKLNDLHFVSVNTIGDYVFVLKNIINQCVDSIKTTVNEDKVKPSANAGLDQNLVCVPNFVTINGGNSSSGTKYIYSWTGPANAIIDSPNIISTNVYKSGIYNLSVIDTINGCETIDQVEVFLNVVIPSIVLDKNAVVTCKNPTITINGAGTTTGNNIIYNWSTTNGNIISGATTFNPTVGSSGNYIIVVEDQSTKCKTTDSVEVKIDKTLPLNVISTPDTLTCATTSIQIDGSKSSNGADFIYNWSTTNGNILSGQNTLNPTVDKNGNYQLIIENQQNGCKDTSYTKVEQDNKKPVALVNVLDTISCKKATTILDGSTSIYNGTNIGLKWKDVSDNSFFPDKTISINVNKKGFYRLIIENQKNGCIDSTLITVYDNFEKPSVKIQSNTILNCKDTNIVINGSVLTLTPYQYLWKIDGKNGNLNTLTPTVNIAGNYLLKAIVTSSGCEDSTSINITSDKSYPFANAGLDTVLSCYNPTILLNGSQSSSGVDYGYQWTETTGKGIQNATKLDPIINSVGKYVLTVINKNNYCTASDTVIVGDNKVVPTIASIKADSLNCIKSEALIIAKTLVNNPDLLIDWTKVNGNVFGKDLSTLQPTVIQGGTYKLLLTNSLNGCRDSAFVKVEIDTIVQKIAIAPPSYITCDNKAIKLLTSGITDQTKYVWTTIDGKFSTTTDIPSPTVTAGGKYIVDAINQRNGCKSSASVIVLTDTLAPKPNILLPNIINCYLPTASLNASSSTPSGLDFKWSTTNGNVQSGNNQSIAIVDKGGTYQLLLKNLSNGCTQNSSILVEEDKQKPIANAGSEVELNCKTNEAILDGSGSSKGVDYTYKWSTVNGKIKANGNQIIATAGSVGNYNLLVINQRNGCSETDAMTVSSSKPDHIDVITKTPKCDSEIGSIEVLGASGGKPPYFYTLKDWKAYSIQIPASENIPIGKYIVRVKDSNDCETSTSVEVKAPSKPTVTLDPKDIEIFELDSTSMTARIDSKFDIDTVYWTSKDSTFRRVDNLSIWAKPKQSSLYHVKVKDINGCIDSTSSWVYIREISEVFIPNAFSPNNDTYNDFFTVFANNRTVAKVSKLEVFNRWGEMVFSRKDFQPNDEYLGWDGSFKGKLLNPAVFVYVVEIEFINGKKKLYKGDITLMQN